MMPDRWRTNCWDDEQRLHLAIETDDLKGNVSDFRIQPASEQDVPIVLSMIKALAEYEKLADQVVATEASLREALFGERRFGEVIIGYAGIEPGGFGLFLYTFS